MKTIEFFIAEKTGIDVVLPENLKIPVGKYEMIFQKEITNFGEFAPMFKSATLMIQVGADERGNLYIRFNYNYQHPRGNNGHTTEYIRRVNAVDWELWY